MIATPARQPHTIRLVLPIRTVSEKNTHEFWAKKAKRVKGQRAFVTLAIKSATGGSAHGYLDWFPNGVTVTLTRIAPRALDDDNTRQATSAVRDGIADAFGTHDRDPRIDWAYAQRRGGVGQYAVEILIESRSA